MEKWSDSLIHNQLLNTRRTAFTIENPPLEHSDWMAVQVLGQFEGTLTRLTKAEGRPSIGTEPTPDIPVTGLVHIGTKQ